MSHPTPFYLCGPRESALDGAVCINRGFRNLQDNLCGGCISGLHIIMLDDFIKKANKVVQKGRRRKKGYLQQIVESRCFGRTRNSRYDVVVIEKSNSSA